MPGSGWLSLRTARKDRYDDLAVLAAVGSAVRQVAARRALLPRPTAAEPEPEPAPDPTPARLLASREFAQEFRGFAAPIPPFHDAWYGALDDPDVPRLLFLAPRSHAKTSVVLTHILREFKRNKHLRVGIFSQTAGMAQSFMREVRIALSTRAPFGPSWIGNPWNNHELTIAGTQTGKDVSLFALGSGGQVTGRRADLLIFDDIESRQTVKTADRRKATREWFARECLPLLSADGRAIVVGTRKHFDDLYAHLLRDPATWRAMLNAPSALLPSGQPLWPERWPLPKLLLRKAELDATDMRAWSQEYENRVLPDADQMFDPEKWPTWERLPAGCRIYQAWDFAISEKTRADYSVCVTAAVDEAKNLYLIHVHRGHFSPAKILDEIDNQYGWYRPDVVVIEEAGFQAPIVQDLINRLKLPARPVKPVGDKILRARYLETRAARGTVYRPAAPVPWWGDFASEFLEFPDGAHDDQVDAAVHVLNLALPMSGWDDYFRKEIARMTGTAELGSPAAGAAPQIRPSESDCALCLDPLPEEPVTEPALIGAYCSRRCCEVAANRPGYQLDRLERLDRLEGAA